MKEDLIKNKLIRNNAKLLRKNLKLLHSAWVVELLLILLREGKMSYSQLHNEFKIGTTQLTLKTKLMAKAGYITIYKKQEYSDTEGYYQLTKKGKSIIKTFIDPQIIIEKKKEKKDLAKK
jgi:DNA-binding HxlR family transcriptional regulator